ncbi:MAG TPA: homoserine dehydrogenase [Chloroflexota bacterium]
MRDTIHVGLLGLGVVGTAVARTLADKAHTIARRVGCPVRLRRVLVRHPDKPRPIAADLVTTNPGDVLEDEAVDIVVEVMGGEHPAYEYILEAIRRGKHVVTANKEVMAKHGPEILARAAAQGVEVDFEAAVGGGIPVIGPFKIDLVANDIASVTAIINGTTNYILTRMARDHVDFDQALREAQAQGYAEADPRNDVEGLDAAYKLAILASLAFRAQVDPRHVYTEGITRLSARDFRYARELGYTIKLLALARSVDGAIEARVHPALVPLQHMLANVDDVYNAVVVDGDLVGRILFYGRGAGAGPTSSAVVADIIDTATRIQLGHRGGPGLVFDGERRIRPMDEVETRYYLRLLAVDRPGVFAKITGVLGDHAISLASVIQKEDVALPDGSVVAEIVLMTHRAQEVAVQEAVRRVAELPVVVEVGALIRVEG